MTDFTIPCETFVRLASILTDFHENANEWFHSVRIDNGQAVASNRHIMAIENIFGNPGIVHIKADPALIAQCKTEAAFGGTLTVTVNEMLKHGAAQTTLGYVHPENAVIFSDEPNDLDKWRGITLKASEPLKASKGGMFWDIDEMIRLTGASPSGKVVFEEFIDAYHRPTLMRDIHSMDWLGVFNPYTLKETYSSATMPTWMVDQ